MVDLPHGTGSAYYAITTMERGMRGEGSNEGKGARASSSSSHFSALSSDAGEAEEVREAKANGKVSRTDPSTSPFIAVLSGFSAVAPNLPH